MHSTLYTMNYKQCNMHCALCTIKIHIFASTQLLIHFSILYPSFSPKWGTRNTWHQIHKMKPWKCYISPRAEQHFPLFSDVTLNFGLLRGASWLTSFTTYHHPKTYSRVTLVFVKSSILLQWCVTLRFQSHQYLCLKQLLDKVGTFFTISSRLMTSGYAQTFIFLWIWFSSMFLPPYFHWVRLCVMGNAENLWLTCSKPGHLDNLMVLTISTINFRKSYHL